jgi:cold shock protein
MSKQPIKATGKVKWFNDRRGYGFILMPGKPDLFVHYSKILGNGHRTLHEGDEVRFYIEVSRESQKLEAVEVEVMGAAA